MDTVQRKLFGGYPRSVGNPHQWWVFTQRGMNTFLEKNNGYNNVYACISRHTSDGVPLSDKVSIDLDTPLKEVAFPETEAEDRKIEIMRSDSNVADLVLGEVLDDAQKVVNWALDNDVPVVGVFSGFGIHLHLLYQEETDAKPQLTSTAVKLKEELDLDTIDRVPIGDPNRLMRVPNCHRVYEDRKCHLYTIPLEPQEILDANPSWLLEEALSRREIDSSLFEQERPEMQIYPDYTGSHGSGSEEEKIREVEEEFSADNEFTRWYLQEVIHMPCVAKRIIQPDPHHFVRMNAAIILYQYGFSKGEIKNFFRNIGWVDWDPEKTENFLNQIRRKKYVEMSCDTLQSKGLCLYPLEDREDECEMHDWPGGKKSDARIDNWP